MVELPQGDVTEIRRGDRDALRILSTDMAKLATTGYIRTERKSKETMPSVGHILFIEGRPTLAIHESEATLFGLEALLEIENDALPIETLLAIHELPMPDAQRVSTLHPNAFLHLETVEPSTEERERWWSNVQLRPGSWRREARLPELEVTVEAPEAVRQRSRAYLQRHEGMERMIRPGDAFLLDAQDPSMLFTLAGHLANHGRPILVISRHDVDSLSVEHQLPVAACHWLSTGNHPRALEPTLESVRTKIDAFLWENMRAVVLIEGVEYLSGLNGDARTIDFLRDVVDGVRMDDHVLLTTADMNAFELEPRHRLNRCLSQLQSSEIEHWLTEPELILDHPLCAPPTEEERTWIEQQLQRAVEHSPAPSTPTSEGTSMTGGHEMVSEEDRVQATEALGEHVRSWTEEERQEPRLPTVAAEPPQTVLAEHNVVLNEPTEPFEHTVTEGAKVVEVGSEIKQQSANKPVFDAPLKPRVPRTAQRIRRKKKQLGQQVANQHRIQTAAAVAHAPFATPAFPERKPVNNPAAIASSLDSYAARQQTAMDKIFQPTTSIKGSLKAAAQQSSAGKHHQLPSLGSGPKPISAVNNRQPIGAKTPLTPLLARPGINSDAKPKHLPREIASRDQASPAMEDQLSSWELEDLERLRKEREGEK
tara:strand:- start:108 stop:2060 length:1953 start_codon:yes stop_codon:yes gene_type:complete